LVRSCHDASEGGLAVAVAEMAFAGGVGADLAPKGVKLPDAVLLFSESTTRFVVEATPERAAEVQRCPGGEVPCLGLGVEADGPRLRMGGAGGAWVVSAPLADLKEAWQKPLRW